MAPSLASSFFTSASVSCPLQCDDMVSGLSPPSAILGALKPPQQQDLTAFLQLVGCGVRGECPCPLDAASNLKLFSVAYFLVSALAGTVTRKILLLL